VVDTEDLVVGEVILVRGGRSAPTTVIDGSSDVDRATITRRTATCPKRVGDDVYAGTMNGNGALTLRVTRAAAGSVVARIVALVNEHQRPKPRRSCSSRKIEQRYSVGVVGGDTRPVLHTPHPSVAPLQTSLLRAVAFMIVASPCAVVLATMPLLAAIANKCR
jgi:cation transport ATPase